MNVQLNEGFAHPMPADVPAPVQLLQWQNVPLATLQPYAPSDASLPMSQYAVTCVMLWAQAQGYAGAIPTWEIGDGCWGVICILNNTNITQTDIPISALSGFDASNTQLWGQSVMRWAVAAGNQLAIPTFQTDGTNVTALVFGSDYPGLFFYDAPNGQLYQSLQQAGKLCNLQDPAVWANAVMRVAGNIGYAAGWPTWEWTTFRGLIGMSGYDYGPLPDSSSDNVAAVLTVLTKTSGMLKLSMADSLADFSGIYATFNAAPISDPGLTILVDCLFGALQAGLNLIPGVGGAIASLVSTAVTVAQDAAANKGGNSGAYTLEQYQEMLTVASEAVILYVDNMHDTLWSSQGDGTLQQVWAGSYTNPLSGCATQLGMLALTPPDIVNGLTYWTELGDQITAQLNNNLVVSILSQLYTIQYRTYQNAPAGKQWWWGTVADVTASDGAVAQYIASSDDDLSVWFSDAVQEPGHARGPYVTFTEWWLQAATDSVLPEYPPSELTYSLFSSDGFGNTTNWDGPFSKETVYTQWFLYQTQLGAYNQNWSYTTDGFLVVATVFNTGSLQSAVAGSTDLYGNLTLNSSDPNVEAANSVSGMTQPVIVNYLAPLT